MAGLRSWMRTPKLLPVLRLCIDSSRYPRLQLLTIKGLLEGTQRLERPLHVRDVTFKKAPRSCTAPAQSLSLPLTSDEPV